MRYVSHGAVATFVLLVLHHMAVGGEFVVTVHNLDGTEIKNPGEVKLTVRQGGTGEVGGFIDIKVKDTLAIEAVNDQDGVIRFEIPDDSPALSPKNSKNQTVILSFTRLGPQTTATVTDIMPLATPNRQEIHVVVRKPDEMIRPCYPCVIVTCQKNPSKMCRLFRRK